MLIDIGILNNSTCKFACKSYTLKHKRLAIHGVETCKASGLSIKMPSTLERVKRCVFYKSKNIKPSEG